MVAILTMLHHRHRLFVAFLFLFLSSGRAFLAPVDHHPLNKFSQRASRTNAFPVAMTPEAVAAVSLPTLKYVALVCLLPTLSGYYRREYTVSYSYGFAISAIAALVLQSLAQSGVSLSSIASVHALALFFYGIRLDLYLLYREVFLQKFRDTRERIEGKAPPGSRLKRTPFIVGCAALYGFMGAPLFATAQSQAPFWSTVGGWEINILRLLVAICWSGFLLAAVGDVQKSWIKARRGEDTLVTSGVYRFFRHPNYTGEVIGWTSSAAAALAASAFSGSVSTSLLLSSGLGVAGIVSILTSATANLEKRQAEKYGDQSEYKKWIEKSWVGFVKKTKKQSAH